MNYEKCMKTSSPSKLCKRGYCSAKAKYKIYPSAYANSYAVKVCKGESPDYRGRKSPDAKYMSSLKGASPLRRWHREAWVNVCERGDGPGGYKVCGSGGKRKPYCRPYYKVSGTKVVTARQLSPSERRMMCRKKRSSGDKRVVLPKRIRSRSASPRASSNKVPIPSAVKTAALKGIKLRKLGFNGGTETGWKRARQLAYNDYVDPHTLRVMRAWFARHGPDASSGGTSYPGYKKWVKAGRPLDVGKNELRGAVAWLIWGGDPAYRWVNSKKIEKILDG